MRVPSIVRDHRCHPRLTELTRPSPVTASGVDLTRCHCSRLAVDKAAIWVNRYYHLTRSACERKGKKVFTIEYHEELGLLLHEVVFQINPDYAGYEYDYTRSQPRRILI